MFSKLRQQRFKDKSPFSTPPKSPSRTNRRSPAHKTSYSKKYFQTQCENYTPYLIGSHLYQGCFNESGSKHGEGVMIREDGTVIIGIWRKSRLYGRALIIHPLAVIMSAGFNRKGQLDGWSICQFQNHVEIQHFDNGIRGRHKFVYEEKEKLWVLSELGQDCSFRKIIQIQKVSSKNKLPSFMTDQQLIQLYSEIINQRFPLKTRKIVHKTMGDNFSYYGYANKDTPAGLGVLFSSEELFLGYFSNGCLNQFGIIQFANGIIYKGEFEDGKLEGQGIFYNPLDDVTSLAHISDGNVSKILTQTPGLELSKLSPSISFNTIKIQQTQTYYDQQVNEILEEMSRFYYRVFSVENESISDKEDDWFSESVSNDDSLNNSDHLKNNSGFSQSVKKSIPYEKIFQKTIKTVQYPHLQEFQREKKYPIGQISRQFPK